MSMSYVRVHVYVHDPVHVHMHEHGSEREQERRYYYVASKITKASNSTELTVASSNKKLEALTKTLAH